MNIQSKANFSFKLEQLQPEPIQIHPDPETWQTTSTQTMLFKQCIGGGLGTGSPLGIMVFLMQTSGAPNVGFCAKRTQACSYAGTTSAKRLFLQSPQILHHALRPDIPQQFAVVWRRGWGFAVPTSERRILNMIFDGTLLAHEGEARQVSGAHDPAPEPRLVRTTTTTTQFVDFSRKVCQIRSQFWNSRAVLGSDTLGPDTGEGLSHSSTSGQIERAPDAAPGSPGQVDLSMCSFDPVKQVPWMMRWLFYAWGSGQGANFRLGLRSPCLASRLFLAVYGDDAHNDHAESQREISGVIILRPVQTASHCSRGNIEHWVLIMLRIRTVLQGLVSATVRRIG